MADTIVDVMWLRERLGDADLVVVDCRFSLSDSQAGRRAYTKGHIPGAVYADLETDLSAPVGADSGRHPLPSPGRLARHFGQWGIDETVQVVAYDDVGGAMAARLWWLARWLGHRHTAVLDGGLPAWVASGGVLESSMPAAAARDFGAPRPKGELSVSLEAVQANITSEDFLLLDARAAERYRGEVEPIDPVAGHVPGALNRPYQRNLDAQGGFHSPESLRQDFIALLDGRPPEDVVHMCGSGVTACHNLLAMEVAGLAGSRLYPGSWSEWVREPGRPVATGAH